jgi:uncharacterized membrane protein YkoI
VNAQSVPAEHFTTDRLGTHNLNSGEPMMRMSLLVSSSLALCVMAFSAIAATPAHPVAQAHVKMAEARSIALKAFPGKIVKEELEKESGGSGLRYSFDIIAAGVTHEIGVDARDGKILENSIDNGKD